MHWGPTQGTAKFLQQSSGAIVVAVVNDPDAPVAQAADVVLPMFAGPERGVAASKSFVASLLAIIGHSTWPRLAVNRRRRGEHRWNDQISRRFMETQDCC